MRSPNIAQSQIKVPVVGSFDLNWNVTVEIKNDPELQEARAKILELEASLKEGQGVLAEVTSRLTAEDQKIDAAVPD